MDRKTALAMIGDTHVMWTEEAGRDLITALGLDPNDFRVETWTANTRDPKGLVVEGVKRNAKVKGYSSFGLVEAIACHLNLEYRSDFLGRGSQQRECARVIREHFARKS